MGVSMFIDWGGVVVVVMVDTHVYLKCTGGWEKRHLMGCSLAL